MMFERFTTFSTPDTTRWVRLPVGVPTNFATVFRNNGNKTLDSVRVGLLINDGYGNVVAANNYIISGPLTPGQESIVQFPPFTAVVPGLYFARACSYLPEDEMIYNDCSSSTEDFHLEFHWATDMGIWSPNYSPHSPQKDSTYASQVPLRINATVYNDGMETQYNIPFHVQIIGPDETLDRDTLLSSIEAGGNYLVDVAPFVPQAPGRYCLRARVGDSVDDYPYNDSVSWCFTVNSIPSGVDGAIQ
jgi:hypothetical protein